MVDVARVDLTSGKVGWVLALLALVTIAAVATDRLPHIAGMVAGAVLGWLIWVHIWQYM